MEKIERLGEREFQRVIDVLGQVSALLDSPFAVFYSLRRCSSVREVRGRNERAPEEMLQILVRNVRNPWCLADTLHARPQ
jgi:hypothetical protein